MTSEIILLVTGTTVSLLLLAHLRQRKKLNRKVKITYPLSED